MLENWIICVGFADYNFSDFSTPVLGENKGLVFTNIFILQDIFCGWQLAAGLLPVANCQLPVFPIKKARTP